MRIEFEENQIGHIASDDADGEFFRGKDGIILYQGPDELEPWYVNANMVRFRQSVRAYENYVKAVTQQESEFYQLDVAGKLREAIMDIEDCSLRKRSYWACVLMQVEEGQL